MSAWTDAATQEWADQVAESYLRATGVDLPAGDPDAAATWMNAVHDEADYLWASERQVPAYTFEGWDPDGTYAVTFEVGPHGPIFYLRETT